MTEPKWCCIGFQSQYESAGERGLAYLIGIDSLGEPEFLQQFRAVAKGDETQIHSESPISVVIDARILFCPSCGVNLSKWYGEHIKELHREGFDLGITKNSQTLILGNPEGW